MRIRIELDDDLVRRVKVVTREDEPQPAIRKAVEEYVHRAAYEGITNLFGKIEFDEEWLAQRRREHPEIKS